MKIRLNTRLQAAAELVLADQPVADIGTDHGYLPLYLVANGICPKAIAADKSAPSCMKAKGLTVQAGYQELVDIRVGDGLQVLQAGEVATVVMCGMGGRLMIDILDGAPAVLAKLQRLVLQPQKHTDLLRQWLVAHGWKIVAERMAFDGGFYYVVLAAEPGDMRLTAEEAVYGPCLLRELPQLFGDYLRFKQHSLCLVLAELRDSEGKKVHQRIRQVEQEADEIQRILNYFPKRGD